MKPDWDKLMKNWNTGARLKSTLIADVDCTAEGKPLCEKVGVSGFPTIKWGDPDSLEDYEGERNYDGLKKFAKENLKPMCSPGNLALCDDEKKAEIESFQAMSPKDLSKKIAQKKKEMKGADDLFNDEVKKLQARYEQMQKDKDDVVAEVKKSGLGIMQAVQMKRKSEKSGDKEESGGKGEL